MVYPVLQVFGWFLEPGELYDLYDGSEEGKAAGAVRGSARAMVAAAPATDAPGGVGAEPRGATACNGRNLPAVAANGQDRHGQAECRRELTSKRHAGSGKRSRKACAQGDPAHHVSGRSGPGGGGGQQRAAAEQDGQKQPEQGRSLQPGEQLPPSQQQSEGRHRCGRPAKLNKADAHVDVGAGCARHDDGMAQQGGAGRPHASGRNGSDPKMARAEMNVLDGKGRFGGPSGALVLRLPGRWQGRRKHVCIH